MPEPLHLFDLPVDILSLIIHELLTAPDGGIISLYPYAARSFSINPLTIFLIHPSIYAIAHPILYGPSNTFLLDLTGNNASHVRRLIDDAAEDLPDDAERSGRQQAQGQRQRQRQLLLRQTGGRFLLLSQDARRRVRKLEMRIDRLRGWIWEDLGPLLQDMAVRGELADLTLVVEFGDAAAEERPQSASRVGLRQKKRVFDAPPLEGLVRLLADPGIREARLRVKGRHDRVWCEFHQGVECSFLSSLRMGRDGDGEDAVKKEVEKMIDVDWRAILKVVDPEGRRRAVAWEV